MSPELELTEDECDLIEEYRILKWKSEEAARAAHRSVTVRALMADLGGESARRIIDAAKELHPDALAFIPMYRSALVLVDTGDHGAEFIVYHDPEWMGADVTTETLPDFRGTLSVVGSRSGFTVYKNGVEMMTYRGWELEQEYSTDPYTSKMNEIRALWETIAMKTLDLSLTQNERLTGMDPEKYDSFDFYFQRMVRDDCRLLETKLDELQKIEYGEEE